MFTRRGAPLTLFATALFACALGVGVSSADETSGKAAADQLTDAIEAGINAGDSKKISELFAADAVAMPAQYATVEGRDAIELFYREFFKTYETAIEIAPVETKLFGDRGFTRGTYVLKMTPRDGQPAVTDHGKYIYLMQRQRDGTWLVTHDMSNSSPQ